MALPEYKAEAKATLRAIYDSSLVDRIPQIDRLRVIFDDDAVAKAAGSATIATFDDAYDVYAAEIDAATDEAGVDAVMGSVTLPE